MTGCVRSATVLIGTVVLGLAVGACGGEATPQVASVGGASATPMKTNTTSSVEAELAAYVKAQQAWVDCLREHGLNPPDPNQYGQVLWADMPVKVTPEFQKAQTACNALQTAPSERVAGLAQPALTEQQKAIKKRYSECMQKNGAPDFPDPGPNGEFADVSWNQTSAGAARATEACAAIIGDPMESGSGVG